MYNEKLRAKDIDEYISGFPYPIQKHLLQLRIAVSKAAPDAEEVISYGMPAFRQNGMLVYFAAHAKHIGFYPMMSAIAAFKPKLAGYEGSKGTVRFPHDKPLPLALISQIVKFRVKENLAKAKDKKRRKKA